MLGGALLLIKFFLMGWLFSESPSNGVASDDPFNGVPSLGEGATNDGANVMLG